MSFGQDYAAGYRLGLQEPGADKMSENLRYINQAVGQAGSFTKNRNAGKKFMPGHFAMGGGGMTANELVQQAKDEAIRRREQELKLKEMDHENERKEMQIQAGYRKMGLEEDISREKMARTGFESKMGALDKDIAGAEKDITAAKGEVAAGTTEQRKAMLQDAMRGFYTGDAGAIQQYFDVFGTKGIGINNVNWGASGEVEVELNNGKKAVFTNPQEAIKSFLIPAEAVLRKKETGDLTEKNLADIKKAGIAQYNKLVADAVIKPEEVSQEEYLADYVKKVKPSTTGTQGRGAGLAEEGPKETGKKSDNVVKVQRNKTTGEIRVTYGDGHTVNYSEGGTKVKGQVQKKEEKENVKPPTKNYSKTTDPKTGEEVRKTVENGETVEYRKGKDGEWTKTKESDSEEKEGGKGGVKHSTGKGFSEKGFKKIG